MPINPPANQNEIKELKSKLQETQEKLAKSEAAFRTEQSKFNTYKSEVRGKEFEFKSLETQHKSTKVNLSSLQRNLEDSEQTLIEKSEKCRILEQKLKATEHNLQLHKNQHRLQQETFKTQLDEKDNTNKKLKDEQTMLKIKLSDLHSNVKLKEREKEDLAQKISELERWQSNQRFVAQDSMNINAKLNEAMKNLSLKSSELDLAKRRLEDAQSKVSLKEREIEEFKRQREAGETARQELTKTITDKQKEIAEMRLDHGKKTDELENLKIEQKTLLEAHKLGKTKLEQKDGQLKELADQLDTEQNFGYASGSGQTSPFFLFLYFSLVDSLNRADTCPLMSTATKSPTSKTKNATGPSPTKKPKSKSSPSKGNSTTCAS